MPEGKTSDWFVICDAVHMAFVCTTCVQHVSNMCLVISIINRLIQHAHDGNAHRKKSEKA